MLPDGFIFPGFYFVSKVVATMPALLNPYKGGCWQGISIYVESNPISFLWKYEAQVNYHMMKIKMSMVKGVESI